ncbi:MAG TPA: lysophospholipid acyltransferase family protein [Defluviicoccus sp.]|nr:lysophospholipid acyltransferase family protein [Defluviicoccus sp.]
MTRTIDYWWRLFGTALSFSVFGIGGLLISVCVFPIIYIISLNSEKAKLRCQYVVHLAFRLFIFMMRSLGVITYEIQGAEKLLAPSGRLIVANHPSLIDIVFIISMLPHALCVVKRAAWMNPFMAGVMWSTGYIANDEPETLIDACVAALRAGSALVIFPEGTRTVPGRPIKLKRGAALIIVKSGRAFTPVTITSEPTTLTKAEKWYHIPYKRVHFRITIRDAVNPPPRIVASESLSQSSRGVSRLLRDVLVTGITQHDESGRGAKNTSHQDPELGRRSSRRHRP